MSDTPRPPRQTRADYRAFVPISTRWSDNDMFGHMNNAAYYTFFDTAVTSWLFSTKLSSKDSMFFVAETGCRYLAEVRYPDRVTVGLRVGYLGSSSVRYEIGIFREDDDQTAAEGLFVHVHIDKATRRPAPLPDELREALGALLP
ncbi:thioesterase family protein [Aureimonas sp. ME7]|uniref:acyl-CoA thioesterase n=1 Tax=Aureimonas sp. ME7 TaxID=2744252 RepID=UPI0015F6D63A|nr:thioesterase family protein [Aureimonas sp. ME7]